MNKPISLAEAQVQALDELARRGAKPHVRLKARAVLGVGRGLSRSQVSRALGVERRSVGRWVAAYLAEGVAGFAIKEGRGRKGQAKREEIAQYVRQAPRQVGVERSRWTLAALAAVVPCLRGMTTSGVWRALRRSGYRYKRGQPVVHSPDPRYGEKRGPWSRP